MNSFVNYNIIYDDYVEAVAFDEFDEMKYEWAKQKIEEMRLAHHRNGDITILLPFDYREDVGKNFEFCRNTVKNYVGVRED